MEAHERVCGRVSGAEFAGVGHSRASRPRPQGGAASRLGTRGSASLPPNRRGAGFTLIEVMVAMSVLILLVMGLTRMFAQATNITSQGLTSVARNSVAETALETILQDVDGMIVNERLGCYIESDAEDAGTYGFGFDDIWFVSTSGDQDDDLPYEYFHYYVSGKTVTNSLGAPYVRFDLHKARMIMSVADKNGVYALQPGQTKWWDKISGQWDDQVLAENVVRFDIYCLGWDGDGWMSQNYGAGGSTEFDSTKSHFCGDKLGSLANVPPAAFDVYLQVTSPEAAVEGGMALVDGVSTELEKKGRELMIKESASYFGRTVPLTGLAQVHHPANHYLD